VAVYLLSSTGDGNNGADTDAGVGAETAVTAFRVLRSTIASFRGDGDSARSSFCRHRSEMKLTSDEIATKDVSSPPPSRDGFGEPSKCRWQRGFIDEDCGIGV
jgi:hypothetical protein